MVYQARTQDFQKRSYFLKKGSYLGKSGPNLKGTAMREFDPSHVKQTSFTCSLVINLIPKNLLVVLECLKDRAFDSTYCLPSFVIMPLTRSVVEC